MGKSLDKPSNVFSLLALCWLMRVFRCHRGHAILGLIRTPQSDYNNGLERGYIFGYARTCLIRSAVLQPSPKPNR